MIYGLISVTLIDCLDLVMFHRLLLVAVCNSYHCRSESLVLIDKILHTLIELSVGNYQNQEVIYERQIIDALSAVFRCGVSLPTARGEVLSLEVNLATV